MSIGIIVFKLCKYVRIFISIPVFSLYFLLVCIEYIILEIINILILNIYIYKIYLSKTLETFLSFFLN